LTTCTIFCPSSTSRSHTSKSVNVSDRKRTCRQQTFAITDYRLLK
jgi:hypothetical protein